MAKGTKTGGRVKGTPNKLTKEIRIILKNLLAKEIKNLPDILEQLEPRERLELIIKIMPYVLPKVRDISHDNNESFDFVGFGQVVLKDKFLSIFTMIMKNYEIKKILNEI